MDEDPDLLLAIALSTSMMDDNEEAQTNPQLKLSGDSQSTSVQEANETSGRENQSLEEKENLMKKYFEDLIEALLKDEFFSSTTDLQQVFSPLCRILEQAPTDFLQLRFLVKLLELFSVTLLNADFKPFSSQIENKERIENLCKAIMRFSLSSLERLPKDYGDELPGTPRARHSKSTVAELRGALFSLLEMMCSAEKIPGKIALLRMKREFKIVAIPSFPAIYATWMSFQSPKEDFHVNNESTMSQINSLVHRLLHSCTHSEDDSREPSVQHEETPESKEQAIACKEITQADIVSLNVEYFEGELQGVSRLLAICSKQLLEEGEHIVTLAQIKSLDKSLNFVAKVIEFMLSDSFDDELVDHNSIPWSIHLVHQLLLIHFEEVNYCKRTKDRPPTLIEKTLFEDIFQLINIKLGDDITYRNVQTYVAAHIFRSLDEIDLEVEKLLAEGISSLFERSFLAPELVSMALDILKSLLTETTSANVGTKTESTDSHQTSIAGTPPPTTYRIGDYTFECSSFHTQKELSNILLSCSSSKKPLIDNLFALLLHTYIQQAQFSTDSQGKPTKRLKKSTGEGGVNPEPPILSDELLFGDLFSENGKANKSTSPETTTVESEDKLDYVLQLARDLLHFFENNIFIETKKALLKEYTRLHFQFSSKHIDVLLFIGFHQSPLIGIEGKYIRPAVLDVDFQTAFRTLAYNLVVNGFFTGQNEVYFLNKIQKTGTWPLFIPLEHLMILARLLMKRQLNKEGNDPVVIHMWEGFLASLKLTIQDSTNQEPVNYEHLQLLLFLFHTLDYDARAHLLNECLKIVVGVDVAYSYRSLLPQTRLLLTIEYIIQHFDGLPPDTNLIEANLFSRSAFASTQYTQTALLTGNNELLERFLKEGEGKVPVFYDLRKSTTAFTLSSSAKSILLNPSFCSYDKLYQAFLSLLFVTPDASVNHQMYYDILCGDYYFALCWRLLGEIPPSPAFLASLQSATILTQQKPSKLTLHYLRWLIRLTFGQSVDSGSLSTTPVISSAEHLKACVFLLASFSESLKDDQTFFWANGIVDSLILILHLTLNVINFLNDKGTEQTTESYHPIQEKHLMLAAIEGFRDFLLRDPDLLLSVVLSLITSYSSFFGKHLHNQLCSESSEGKAQITNLVLAANVSKPNLQSLLEKFGFTPGTVSQVMKWNDSKSASEAPLSISELEAVSAAQTEQVLNQTIFAHSSTSSKFILPLITSVQRVLSSLVDYCRILVCNLQNSKFGNPSVIFNRMPDITRLLLHLIHHSCFGFIVDKCKSLLEELLPVKEQLHCLLDLHKLQKIEELNTSLTLEFMLDSQDTVISPDINLKFDNLEPVICENISFVADLLKDPARAIALHIFYFGSTTEGMSLPTTLTLPSGNITTYLRLLLNNQNKNINEKILQLLHDFCKQQKQDFNFKHYTVNEFLKLDPTFITTWFQQKLLGVFLFQESDSNPIKQIASPENIRKAVVRFVDLLTENNENKEIGLKIFDTLLATLPVAFVKWTAFLQDYFYLLQSLGVQQNQLQRLVSGAISLLSSPEFQLQQSNSQTLQLSAFDLLLELIELVLKQCFKADDVQPMEEEEPEDIEQQEENNEEEERELANKLCTYTVTGNNFKEQHWYYCYTCLLTYSEGICSVCAKVCHKGHEVSYSRKSRFFCDCGDGTVRGMTCQALKPRKYEPKARAESIKESEKVMTCCDSDSEHETKATLTRADPAHEPLLQQVRQDNLPQHVYALLEKLLLRMKKDGVVRPSVKQHEDLFSVDKTTITKADLFQHKRSLKAGSFEVKLKFDTVQGRDLKNQIANFNVSRSALCINSKGYIAVAEGDKVTIADVSRLLDDKKGVSSPLDKITFKQLSKNPVPFEIVSLKFNPVNENYIAVAGLKECCVLTLNSRSEVVDQLSIDMSLDALGQSIFILQVHWIPGSQVKLAVVTNRFVKIYDLSRDNICPLHYFTLLEDAVKDTTFISDDKGSVTIILMSNSGLLFTQPIVEPNDGGPCILTGIVQVPDNLRGKNGASVYYSSSMNMLFWSYDDGRSLGGRLDSTNANLVGVFQIGDIAETAFSSTSAARSKIPFNSWIEVPDNLGSLICLSRKANLATGLWIKKKEIHIQSLKGSSSRIEGFAAVSQPTSSSASSKYHSCILFLLEDGSLQRLDVNVKHPPTSEEEKKAVLSKSSGKADSSYLLSLISSRLRELKPETKPPVRKPKKPKRKSTTKPVFPVDFFEKVECITPNVVFAGDVIQCYSSEVAKQRLASNEEYIVSPNQDAFNIVIQNNNHDLVMVGVRVLVGSASIQHIPQSFKIFERTIDVTAQTRRWYDIPFTVEESLTADKEFTLIATATYTSGNAPLIDSIEVYALTKEEFGWKEKMEEQEAEETENETAPKPETPLEKTIVNGLSVLVFYFSAFPPSDKSKDRPSIPSELMRILPPILNDTRLLVLHRPVRRLLAALLPNRSAYYQLKDSTQIQLIADTLRYDSSSLDAKTVTKFVRVASKVALRRRKNFSKFLDQYPSFPVTLMKLFWSAYSREGARFDDMEETVAGLVEIIYGYARYLQSKAMEGVILAAVRPAFALLKDLLFSPHESLRSITSQILPVLLLQESNSSTPPMEDAMDVDTEASDSTNKDSSTTIQFSCDKCRTVPIVDKRWSCNVCQDYDLCDVCYQQGKEFPPPHQASHPMTCFLIEEVTPLQLQPMATNNPEIPKDEDEDEDAQLRIALAMSLGQATPTIPQSKPVGDPITFSPDHPLRDLLLALFLEDLSVIKEHGGLMALSYMQIVHALAQQTTTADVSREKLKIERLITGCFGDMKQVPSVSPRTPKLEGDILSLMLFANLISPPKEKRKTDSKTLSASKLFRSPKSKQKTKKNRTRSKRSRPIKAIIPSSFVTEECCKQLRQKGMVEYLFSLAQQLYTAFKKQPKKEKADGEAHPSGGLLKVQHEISANNVFPFFSESYVKKHSSDLFEDYQNLLTEAVFQLAVALHRPERASSKEKTNSSKPLFSPKWLPLLCLYINTKQTSSVRKQAKKLLLSICRTKQKYYEVRDECLLSTVFKKIVKYRNSTQGFIEELPYVKHVKLIGSLSNMWDVAFTRAANWQHYCSNNEDVLPLLFKASFFLSEESVLLALKLLARAFIFPEEGQAKNADTEEATIETKDAETKPNDKMDRKEKRKLQLSRDKKESTETPRKLLEMQKHVAYFLKEGDLDRFVNTFLLESNTCSARTEARNFIHGLWKHAHPQQQDTIFSTLWNRIPNLPSYGRNANEFTELLSFVVHDSDMKRHQQWLDRMVLTLLDALYSQNRLLSNHPNAEIYRALHSLVEFDGYYLESEPCLVCNDPEVPYSQIRLDALKAETKFTDSTQIVKFTCSHTIQSVMIVISDIRKSKMVRTINLYYNNKAVTEVSELRNKWSAWKKAKSCHLVPNQTELKVEFPIPITAINFMIEYAAFYENLQAMAAEKLQCPRCNRLVTDKYGICKPCKENAFQCRQCRNINYENLNAFLCNECGFSKYGTFNYSFNAKPSFATERMESDEDRKKGQTTIDKELANAHRRYQQMSGYKKPLAKLLANINSDHDSDEPKETFDQIMSIPTSSGKVNRKIAIAAVLYGKECKSAFDSLSKSVQVLLATRRELIRYDNSIRKVAKPTTIEIKERPPNRCYGCSSAFVSQCLSVLDQLAKKEVTRNLLIKNGILQHLMANNLHQGSAQMRRDVRKVICLLAKDNLGATVLLNNLLREKLDWCLQNYTSINLSSAIQNEMLLLTESCLLDDSGWESRLKLLLELFFKSINCYTSPVVSEHMIYPCLHTVVKLCQLPFEQPVANVNVPAQEKDTQSKTTERALDKSQEKSASTKTSTKTADKSEKQDKKALTTKEDSPKSRVVHNKLLGAATISYQDWLKNNSYHDWISRYQKYIIVNSNVSSEKAKQELPSRSLLRKYASIWKRHCGIGYYEMPMQKLLDESWIKRLLLSKCSQSLRSETATLIESICQGSPSRMFRFLDFLTNLLPDVGSIGECAGEFFELYKKLMEPIDNKLYLTVKGFLPLICRLVTEEIERIRSLENSYTPDITQGYVLKTFIHILAGFLEVPAIKAKFKRDKLMERVLDGFLSLRDLILQKTKLTDDSSQLLLDLLNSLHSESEEDNRQFMAACIKALNKHDGGRTPVYIFEQLCNIVCPTKPEPVYYLILTKAPSHEEFIRGNMNRHPYSSADIGLLMRDVKNKICTDLDLKALLEDDNGMELLVNNKIIKLDLSIRLVYEQVWRRSLAEQGTSTTSENPPMVVVYRLQGLEEATEDVVENLSDDTKEENDPEEEYKITSVMEECGGLEAMMNRIHRISDFDAERELAHLVLKLLFHCCKIRVNRRRMVEMNAITVLLEKLKLVFPRESHADIAEQLLLIIESIVEEANLIEDIERVEIDEQQKMETDQIDSAISQMTMFLEKLQSPLVRCNPRIVKTMTRILPYLTYGQQKIMEILTNFFLPYLSFEQYDLKEYEEPLHTFYLECFVAVANSIKADYSGNKLKDMIMEKGVINSMVGYLKNNFAPKLSVTDEWQKSLSRKSLPFVLQLLTGLSVKHPQTQLFIFSSDVIPILHNLEQVNVSETTKKIGILAETLLDSMVDPQAQEAVNNVRDATKKEKEEQSKKHREEVLRQIGLRQTNPGKITTDVVPRSIVDLEEEGDFACKVCREGYTYMPEEILGFYTYTKRVNLEQINTGGRQEPGYSTVTHFHIVHFSCHRDATKAERSMKVPREEWEGATLRNSLTKCNNLFPIQGPKISDESYTASVNKFWGNMNNISSCKANHFRLLTHDLKFLLLRFAKEESFSVDSKGGGRDSNIKAVPFMLQMGLYLLDQKDGTQRRIHEKALLQFLAQSSDLWVNSCVQGDNICYFAVLTLYLLNLEEWKECRLSILKRLLVFSFAEHAFLVKANATSPPELDDFKICKPMLVHFAFIDKLQEKFKKPTSNSTSNIASLSHKSDEAWLVEMKNFIRFSDVKCLDEMKDLLGTYENMWLAYENFMEFFDDIGILRSVLAEASSCEDWVAQLKKLQTN